MILNNNSRIGQYFGLWLILKYFNLKVSLTIYHVRVMYLTMMSMLSKSNDYYESTCNANVKLFTHCCSKQLFSSNILQCRFAYFNFDQLDFTSTCTLELTLSDVTNS